jgi:Protein of unknown function (DUF1153)
MSSGTLLTWKSEAFHDSGMPGLARGNDFLTKLVHHPTRDRGLEMSGIGSAQAKFIIGPYGTRLSIGDLPPRDTQRWVIRRKAEVVAAVRGGLLSLEEACSRYGLTTAEFTAWQSSIDRHGLRGLQVKRLGYYRRREVYGLS